ncbi:DUF72 domain-containing protein [Candidatus Enterococcus willemsii]|uniref:DUF72 domain-containing protein n=1 Tax=Candidatus Enterococcus willemsii TaxID=1857215 RepID=A0ABQ6YZ99_9ENTE|nr:DUF72 domain-containing protein [Enterococcus sp. CU12B]KAF1303781.1 hypothetical protein BAU17_11385 [Enterococcus sp. CU12B]
MIRIGCTSFSEHDYLTGKKVSTLYEYAGHLPLVEMDTGFYRIPSKENIENWIQQVPNDFKFIMKVHKVFTKHQELEAGQSLIELAKELRENMAPMIAENKLFCLLAQFPASFKCVRENVDYLRELRLLFKELPVAIEFRDRSWYDEKYLASTRKFMQDHEFSLVIVDEPKKLSTTVPLDAYVTNSEFTFFRFHGRNDVGWTATGPDAQKVRTNYRYKETELAELKQAVDEAAPHTKEIAIIFNNNAGGDAAENALQFKEKLHLDYTGLNPSQLDLF